MLSMLLVFSFQLCNFVMKISELVLLVSYLLLMFLVLELQIGYAFQPTLNLCVLLLEDDS